MSEFERWLTSATDERVREELLAVRDLPKEIEDRFYCALTFGTGGLRGVLGAGTNRMNVHVIARATAGLGEYLLQNGGKHVVIAYDSRRCSKEFAALSADVLSSKGIRVSLFSELTPTPVLSFAVRHLGADAGIVITASHNPKEYNGYKVYNALGCQISEDAASAITAQIEACDYFDPFTPDAGLIQILGDDVAQAFLESCHSFSLTPITKENAPRVVYSPLHGAGRRYVEEILARIGVDHVHTVAEQALPDPDFTTAPFPNPEERAALSLALRDAELYRPDIVMATDPDADRIGIALPDENGEYRLLNGNETGSLILRYLLERKRELGCLREGETVIKTVVTTDIVFSMARAFGLEVREVLTGFKYIGEEMEKTPRFLLGMEESYGYLVGTHVRDKDAVSAAMMLAQACAYYKEKGRTLYGELQELYREYGYYRTSLHSFTMKGKDGMERMRALIASLRLAPPRAFEGQSLTFDDFGNGLNGLPPSDVLRFQNENCRIIIRPSGTEPKIKLYLQVKGDTQEAAQERLSRAETFAKALLE